MHKLRVLCCTCNSGNELRRSWIPHWVSNSTKIPQWPYNASPTLTQGIDVVFFFGCITWHDSQKMPDHPLPASWKLSPSLPAAAVDKKLWGTSKAPHDQEQWCHHIISTVKIGETKGECLVLRSKLLWSIWSLYSCTYHQTKNDAEDEKSRTSEKFHGTSVSVCCESWPSWMLPSHVSFRACMVRRDPQSDLKSICDLLGMTPCTLKCSLQCNQMGSTWSTETAWWDG